MGFKFIYTNKALADLESLDTDDRRRIAKKIAWLEVQEETLWHGKKLTDSSIGDIRFRIGDYRVAGFVDPQEKNILITRIGHRKEIYRRK